MNKYERYRLHECSRICDDIMKNKTFSRSQISKIQETLTCVKKAEDERYYAYKSDKVRERYQRSSLKVNMAILSIPSGDNITVSKVAILKDRIEDALTFDKSFDAYSTWYTGMSSADEYANDCSTLSIDNSGSKFRNVCPLIDLLTYPLGVDTINMNEVSLVQIIKELKKRTSSIFIISGAKDDDHRKYIVESPYVHIEWFGGLLLTDFYFNVVDNKLYMQYTIDYTDKNDRYGFSELIQTFEDNEIKLNYENRRYKANYNGEDIELYYYTHGYDCDTNSEDITMYIDICKKLI